MYVVIKFWVSQNRKTLSPFIFLGDYVELVPFAILLPIDTCICLSFVLIRINTQSAKDQFTLCHSFARNCFSEARLLSRPASVGFAMHKGALDEVLLRIFWFSLVSIFPPVLHKYILLV